MNSVEIVMTHQATTHGRHVFLHAGGHRQSRETAADHHPGAVVSRNKSIESTE